MHTELRKEVLGNIEAFGEDLGLAGNVVVPYETRRQETATEVIQKNWPGDFATFNPQRDP